MTYCLPDEDCPPGVVEIFGRSRTALSLASTAHDDLPLVLVNEPFCTAIGYRPEMVLGRNCRFLQPPGGPGPVKQRMREFLADPSALDGRFVIPNITGRGEPFLNVVYMNKLRHPSGREYILGSQFAVMTGRERPGSYEVALRKDLHSLSEILSEGAWLLTGSMQAIAETSALLARHRMGG